MKHLRFSPGQHALRETEELNQSLSQVADVVDDVADCRFGVVGSDSLHDSQVLLIFAFQAGFEQLGVAKHVLVQHPVRELLEVIS